MREEPGSGVHAIASLTSLGRSWYVGHDVSAFDSNIKTAVVRTNTQRIILFGSCTGYQHPGWYHGYIN